MINLSLFLLISTSLFAQESFLKDVAKDVNQILVGSTIGEESKKHGFKLLSLATSFSAINDNTFLELMVIADGDDLGNTFAVTSK